MKTLKQATIAELEAALKERKQEKNTPPKPVVKPDFTALIETVTTCVNDMVVSGYWCDDVEQHIYEAAMTAVYGPKYFEWLAQQDY